jgi:hypothetical protein
MCMISSHQTEKHARLHAVTMPCHKVAVSKPATSNRMATLSHTLNLQLFRYRLITNTTHAALYAGSLKLPLWTDQKFHQHVTTECTRRSDQGLNWDKHIIVLLLSCDRYHLTCRPCLPPDRCKIDGALQAETGRARCCPLYLRKCTPRCKRKYIALTATPSGTA